MGDLKRGNAREGVCAWDGGLVELEGVFHSCGWEDDGRYRHGGQQDAISGTEFHPPNNFPIFFVKVYFY